MVVESTRQYTCGRGLADPAHACEYIGLMDAIRRERVGERAHHCVLPDQIIEAGGAVFAREYPVGNGRGRCGRGCIDHARVFIMRVARPGTGVLGAVEVGSWNWGGGRLDKDPP